MSALASFTDDELLRAFAAGEQAAAGVLLGRHRNRLKSTISIRLDSRIAARVDPSDVVQETLIAASQRLDQYVRAPEIPFFPWLRRIAMDRVVDIHRRHLRTQARTVLREEPLHTILSSESAVQLADCLYATQTSPSGEISRSEKRKRVQEVLDAMSSADREVLILVYLERLSQLEAAAVLGISAEALRSRVRRALLRFGDRIQDA